MNNNIDFNTLKVGDEVYSRMHELMMPVQKIDRDEQADYHICIDGDWFIRKEGKDINEEKLIEVLEKYNLFFGFE